MPTIDVKMEIFGRKGQFTSTEFKELPFAAPISPVQGTPNKVLGLDGWPDDKILRNIRYQVAMMESALELCRQGLAVAYLPTFVAQLHNEHTKPASQLAKLNSPRGLTNKGQPVYLIKRKSDVETPFMRSLAKALRAISD